MAAGDLLTADYQLELDGLLMGDGTDFRVLVDGPTLLGIPDFRGDDSPRPQDHGSFPQRRFADVRVVDIPFEVTGADADDVLDKWETFSAKWHPIVTDSSVALAVQYAGRRRLLFGHPERLSSPDLGSLRFGRLRAVAQFIATDPRLYDAHESGELAGLGSTIGGFGFPFGFPFGFGTATAGLASVTNTGNFETRPTITISATGLGIQNPTIELLDTGEQISLTIGLSDGDSLVLDFDARTVVLNGSASRINTVDRPGSTWFVLAPGENTIRVSGSGSGGWTIQWRSAWL